MHKEEQSKKPNIFRKRLNLKPYDYPQLTEYVDAIRHSYWIHTEFNYTSDIQDFKTSLSSSEQSAIKNTMLAISQIEVAVKTFWGDLYKKMPKPEIGSVGSTFAECHVEGTEILTPKGWVDFKEIDVDDSVLQYNADGSFNFTKVNEVVKKPYKGDIINFKKQKLDVRVTPNHRIIYFNRKGDLLEKFAKDINLHSDILIPFSGNLKSEKETITNLSWFDKLKIAIQADGSLCKYTARNGERRNRGKSKSVQQYQIGIKKERKKERLINILENLDLDYKETKDNREGYIRITIDLPLGVDYKTFEWVNLEDKDSNWCNEFIEELAEWDGCRLKDKKDCTIKYSTTNKSCADIAQVVGIGANYLCSINKYVDNRKETYSDVYTVSFIKNRELVGTNTKKEILQYDGNVYCVNVESGMIITRYNDTTFISGNSEVRHHDAYSHLLEILGLNEEFGRLSEDPVMRGRIRYLETALSKTGGTNKEFSESVVLFSLFIEHVSLFSQFLIIMAFNKHKNVLKGISNVVEATSKEEQIHGDFGIDLIKIIKEENPKWFDEENSDAVKKACRKAFKHENRLIDWIFEDGELDFLPKNVIKEFLKNRFNKSLESIGIEKIFEVDGELLSKTDWFDDEIIGTKHGDFFVKRSINYSKRTKSITSEDLF